MQAHHNLLFEEIISDLVPILLVVEESVLKKPSFIESAQKTIMYQIALLKNQILCPVLMIRYKKRN